MNDLMNECMNNLILITEGYGQLFLGKDYLGGGAVFERDFRNALPHDRICK